jgi:tetratricopeptide (TPR) repeat protein
VRIITRLTVVTAALVLAVACMADLFEDGKALHKAGKYPEAAAKLEQAAKENPSDARVWWQLNFTYHKLNKDAEALKAVQKAGQLDPSHGFASEPGKYEQTLSDRQQEAGGSGSSNASVPRQSSVPAPPRQQSGSTTAGTTGGNLTQQLINGDVFVERGMNVDAARLQQVAQELRPTVVKFVVFNSNANSRTLDREAGRIRNFLKSYINQGEGYVIAGSRGAVAVSSPSLSDRDKKDLLSQVAPVMSAGRYTEGLEKLARGLVHERAPRAASTGSSAPAAPGTAGSMDIPVVHHGPNWLLIFVVGAAGVVVIWLIVRSVKSKSDIAARRGPLERQKSGIISGINYLEENAAALDAGNAARVNEARIAAGTKLDEASRILSRSANTQDINRAQSLLDQAEGDIQRGRAAIDRALGGGAPVAATAGAAGATGAAGGGYSGAAPPVYPQTTSATTDWSSLPKEEKGVCFFCSRPLLLRELTPVTVNLDGKQQKVLACPDDLATIKSGQVPQIRAFQQNGQYVPWYAYQGYDPYRDYYNSSYWGGGAGSFVTGMLAMNAIDNMYWNWHHPMGWGWGGGYGYGGNTYVFYPDHDNYRDYYSGQAAGHGDFSDIDRTSDSSGVDFLSPTGGDSGNFGGSAGDIGGDRS